MSTEIGPDSPPRAPSLGENEPYPSTRFPGEIPSAWYPETLFAGRYRIVRELGRGGMGVVSQARDTRLPRDVAIKVPTHTADPESLLRFRREAEAAAMLDHPNICRILDLGEADGLPFIVLSFIRGRTLADVMRARTLDPIRSARLVRSVARTIAFAHDGGIAHRDLKPANLMIGPHREPIVMDFGLARLVDQERGTRTGQVFGTLPYMSPEQVQGQAGQMGKSCDIYTLGVIFYELLTGRLPFQGPIWEVARQIVDASPSPPSSIRPFVDPGLDAIVLRAMSKEIDRRFDSMGEFAETIEIHLRRSDSRSSLQLKKLLAPAAADPPSEDRPAVESILSIRLGPEPLRGSNPLCPKFPPGVVWAASGLVAILGVLASHADRPGEPSGPKKVAGPDIIAARPSPSVTGPTPGAVRVIVARPDVEAPSRSPAESSARPWSRPPGDGRSRPCIGTGPE